MTQALARTTEYTDLGKLVAEREELRREIASLRRAIRDNADAQAVTQEQIDEHIASAEETLRSLEEQRPQLEAQVALTREIAGIIRDAGFVTSFFINLVTTLDGAYASPASQLERHANEEREAQRRLEAWREEEPYDPHAMASNRLAGLETRLEEVGREIRRLRKEQK